jgi:hypothetical protein
MKEKKQKKTGSLISSANIYFADEARRGVRMKQRLISSGNLHLAGSLRGDFDFALDAFFRLFCCFFSGEEEST